MERQEGNWHLLPMDDPMLPCVVVETGPNPDASVIWLHGLGADGHDFEPIVPELGLPESMNIRFIFPHAPSMPVTVNGGYIMPAWYDIRHTEIGYEQDEKGVRASAREIQLLIEREQMHGIAADRIVLAGFSQGGAMALHTGLRQSEPLGGIMALSCYLLLDERLEAERTKASESSSVFMAHGVDDPIVPFSLGDDAQRRLSDLGYQVQWHSYPMEHSVCMEEVRHISQWLRSVLG